MRSHHAQVSLGPAKERCGGLVRLGNLKLATAPIEACQEQ